jgi:hypothetical protein
MNRNDQHGTGESTEFFHTHEEFEVSGFELLLRHTRQFLSGSRTVPVTLTWDHIAQTRLTFTPSSEMCRLLTKKDKKVLTSWLIAAKYGFLGGGRGGRNGIFLQPKRDRGLRAKTAHFVEKFRTEIVEDLQLDADLEPDARSLEFVKIVHHDPSGKRVVGVRHGDRAIFLGTASY